jgi:hypothetical protein
MARRGEVDFRALSEGLDIPNDFAIWANNLSKGLHCACWGQLHCISTLLEWPVLHLKCQLSADPFEVSLNLIDTSQGRLNIGQYILRSHLFQEVRA